MDDQTDSGTPFDQPPIPPPPAAPPPAPGQPWPQVGAGQPPPPQAAKRKLPVWLIVVIVVAVLALCACGSCTALGIIGASQSETSSDDVSDVEPAGAPSAPATPVADPQTSEPQEPEEEPEQPVAEEQPVVQEQPKKWVKVAELSGNANKRSAPFELTGAPARLKYTVKGDMVVCAVYLLPEGTDLMTEGGFPEVMLSEAGSDQTFLSKGAGRYFIDVQAANCQWSVVIEEER